MATRKKQPKYTPTPAQESLMERLPFDPEADAFGFSPKYWRETLTEEHREMYRAIRPLRRSVYSVSVHIHMLQSNLDRYKQDAEEQGGVFDLNPDFQRGHVWSREKQVAFVEAVLRGTAPMTFRFNSAVFGEMAGVTGPGYVNHADFVCIDGLQRITALLAFNRGEFQVFGRYFAADLKGTPFGSMRYHATFEVFAFRRRIDLLRFYRDLNAGGVVHTDEEIRKVEAMIEVEKQQRAE